MHFTPTSRATRTMLACFVTAASALPAAAVERFVPGQYATIQAAIDACSPADEVVIDPGTYTGVGNRDLDFGGKAITVRGTDPNDPAVVEATVIDCQGSATEVRRGFNFHSGEGPDSIVAGLTITNGNVTAVGSVRYGGAICCVGASPTIRDCVIERNAARSGAGIYASSSDVTIEHCTIRGNSSGGIYSGYGGGVYCNAGSPTLVHCIISDNSAGPQGSYGGGLWLGNNISAAVTNNLICGNAASIGAGLECGSGESLIAGCIIRGNEASTTAGSGGGGGVHLMISNSTVRDCAIVRNSAGGGGGAFFTGGTPLMTGCTVNDNTATDSEGGGMYFYYRSAAMLADCAIQRNTALSTEPVPHLGGGLFLVDNSMPTVTRCWISENTAAGRGGGVCAYGAGPQLHNCLVQGNSVVSSGSGYGLGGGVYCYNTPFGEGLLLPLVAGCTISGNSAPVAGGGLYCDLVTLTATNSVVYGNTAATDPQAWPATSITYSCVQGGFSGTGNIDADPLFLDPLSGDYHLLSGSPCIDVGSNADVPTGVTADIDGDARIIDGNADAADTVDMGMDEYRPDLAANPRPTPDPMSIDSVTVAKVSGITVIRLRAKAASIPGQPGRVVEYKFEWVAGTTPGPDSGWQSSAVFDATPVVAGTWYAYRVKARNAANPSAETAWSPMAVMQAVGADYDLDGDVDLTDFSFFQACFNGPNRPPAQSGCGDADIDSDADVDLADFSMFQSCFNGPNRPSACL